MQGHGTDVLAAVIAAVLACSAAPAMAADPETVRIPAPAISGGSLTGYLSKPATAQAPLPVIVAMHGCAGMFTPSGKVDKRSRAWATDLTGAGYAVLFLDSFGSRGLGSQCTVVNRQIVPADRAADAFAAVDWIATQPGLDANRIGLIGWSHGGSSALWTVAEGVGPHRSDFKMAVAFYPGCAPLLRSNTWRPRLPIEVHMGELDDWTPIEPCRALAQRHRFDLTAYPGAYHGFDAPDTPVRVRTGLTYSKSGDGTAHVGTEPVARAAAIKHVLATFAARLAPLTPVPRP